MVYLPTVQATGGGPGRLGGISCRMFFNLPLPENIEGNE